jgi:RHS repeat-associated protein
MNTLEEMPIMKHKHFASITHIETSSSNTNRTYARWRNIPFFAVILLLWCATALSVSAQNIQYNQKSVDLGLRSDLKINPSTRAVEMQIPLGFYAGRAGLNVPITISYSSKVWRVGYQGYSPGQYTNGQPTGNGYVIAAAQYAEHSRGGWTSSVGIPVIDNYSNSEAYNQFGNPTAGNCSTSGCFNVDRLLVRMPDGSTHELRSSDQPYDAVNPPQLPDDLYAVDGSRLRYQRSTSTLFMPDGSRFIGGQYIDRNGNTLTYGSPLTDTLGRSIPSLPLSGIAGDYSYTPLGMNGTYTFKWRNLGDAGVLTTSQQLQYIADSGCPPGAGSNSSHLFSSSLDTCIGNAGSVFNPVVLSQIVLPTGQAYIFTYNIYGEVDKVQLPTGGYERYEYGQIIPLSSMTVPYSQGNRGVIKRWVSASGLSADEVLWQYGDLGVGGTVTILAPDGSLTERYLHTDMSMSGTFGYSQDGSRAGLAYDERYYSAPDAAGARQMLRRKLTEWTITGSNATGLFPGAQQYANRNPRITKEVEILLDTGGDALTKTTTYGYDTTYQFTVGVEQTSKNEYDYLTVDQSTARTGAIGTMPMSATPLRSTETAYLTGDANYRTRNLLGLPTSSTIKDAAGAIVAQTTMSYDEGAYPLLSYSLVTGWSDPATSVRGLVTTMSRWLNTTNTWLSTHAQYDQCGSLRTTWDAEGNQSQTDYTDSFSAGGSRNTYAYPTSATSPIPDSSEANGSSSALVTSSQYDFLTGLVMSSTDANGQTTSFDYNDPLNRLKTITRPTGGGLTTYEYGDSSNNLYIRTQTTLDSSRSFDSYQYYDGLGRAIRSLSYDADATSPWIAVDTYYDQMGRVQSVSNPYRVSSPGGATTACGECTTTEYDDLGRVKRVVTPDGAQMASNYSTITTGTPGTDVTVTDQAGKKRKSLIDALGQLIKVNEDPTGLNYQTTYGYDPLGNLRTVTQGDPLGDHQTRTFNYDSLSRLTSALNPESGTATYHYNNNGNLDWKTDARGVKTSYTYDSLNRVKTRSYSLTGTTPPNYIASPDVSYFYDGTGMPADVTTTPAFSKGNLTAIKSSVSETIYTEFDALGHIKKHRQIAEPGMPAEQKYLMEYSYDLAGNMISQKYPSGKLIETEYDAGGRIAGVKNQANYYAGAAPSSSNRIQYTAHGAVSDLRLGNGLWEHTLFNNRLQPYEIGLGTAKGGNDRLKLAYGYGTTNNNGNVLSQTITVPTINGVAGVTLTQSYAYDQLNRLQSVSEGSGSNAWAQGYIYTNPDGTGGRFGNRRIDPATTTQSLIPTSNPTFNMGNNRFATDQGYDYDDAGNLKTAPGYSYSYDSENRMVSADSGQQWGLSSYSYDGDGHRIKKVAGADITTVFVYNVAGQMVAEYSNSSPSGDGGTSYLTTDNLGTPRIITGTNINNAYGGVKARHDYLPFGEEISSLNGRTPELRYSGDNVRQKFTQKERDLETGLDYFQARYYSSSQGRFTSPDEFTGGPDELYYFAEDASNNPTFYADLTNPQSLNKYQYTYNNPLRYVDLDGHEVEDMPDQQEGKSKSQSIPAPVPPVPYETSQQTIDAIIQAAEAVSTAVDRTRNALVRRSPIIAIIYTMGNALGRTIGLYPPLPPQTTTQPHQQEGPQTALPPQVQVQPQTAAPAQMSPRPIDKPRDKGHKKGKGKHDKHTNKTPGQSRPPNFKPRTRPRPQDMEPKTPKGRSNE